MIKLSQPNIPEHAIDRVGEILRSGRLVHGEECVAFEQELGEFLGVKHALLVSSGTAALHLALLAADTRSDDVVLIPDFTFAATANVVEIIGARAVIVDVEPDSYNMDPVALEKTIKNWSYPERINAMVPVLQFGNPENALRYREIAQDYNIHIVEDAACAFGAADGTRMIGTIGELGCYSFHPRKTLTTGEGGLVVSNDSALAEKVALLRNHGMSRTEQGPRFRLAGLNYRLTEFQAAIGRSLLRRLPEAISIRRNLAAQYDELLGPLEDAGHLRRPQPRDGHCWQTYMVTLSESVDRNTAIKVLRDNGIEANLGAHSMSSLGYLDHPANVEINAYHGGMLFRQGLALPLHEGLKGPDIEFVVSALSSLVFHPKACARHGRTKEKQC